MYTYYNTTYLAYYTTLRKFTKRTNFDTLRLNPFSKTLNVKRYNVRSQPFLSPNQKRDNVTT